MTHYIEFDQSLQADLIVRTKAGDRSAFARIYDETLSQVYRYAATLTRSREDAEDLTAETYERALRCIDRYQSREVPIAIWLLRIARNVAYERMNKSRRESTVPMPDNWLERLASEDEPVDAALVREALLSRLTPAQRDVVTLRLMGLRGREIAQALCKAEGTVKALQFAAMRTLRRTVSE